MKILGLNIDVKLSWTSHLDKISNKCNRIFAMMYPLKNILSVNILLAILVKTCIFSTFNYAAIVWQTPNKFIHENLETLLRKYARYVLCKN